MVNILLGKLMKKETQDNKKVSVYWWIEVTAPAVNFGNTTQDEYFTQTCKQEVFQGSLGSVVFLLYAEWVEAKSADASLLA